MVGTPHVKPYLNTKPLQALINQPLVQEVGEILGRTHVRLVGGAVRDACLKGLGLTSKQDHERETGLDLDMATQWTPEQVKSKFDQAQALGQLSPDLKLIPTGLAHGTWTLFAGPDWYPEPSDWGSGLVQPLASQIELTSLRSDRDGDGRHATVIFTQDWDLDAQRRDFSFNALYLGLSGQLHDPCDGLADLAAGRLRFIGQADHRLAEDHLRLLRYFRFYAHFARQNPAANLRPILSQSGHLLHRLSGERIKKELWSWLPLPGALDALHLFEDLQLSPYLFGASLSPKTLQNIANLAAWEQSLSASTKVAAPAPLRRLLVLLDQDTERFQSMATRLRLSKADSKRGQQALNRYTVDARLFNPDTLADCLYDLSFETWLDHVLLGLVNKAPIQNSDQINLIKKLIAKAQAWHKPAFPLSGHDLIQLGFEPGPHLGSVLNQLETCWRNEGFSLSKQALLEQARNRRAQIKRAQDHSQRKK